MKKTISTAALTDGLDKLVLACHESYIADFLRREATAEAHTSDLLRSNSQEKEEDEESYIVQKHGNIAIVEIKGRLTNSDRYYNRDFGLLSYAEIQRAYAQIAEDDEIEYILEDYDTPGGTVAMMSETEEIMRAVGRIKPRVGFVGSMAASAGYYLIRGCNSISASSMAEVGSIGVMQVTTDMVKMFEDFGIGLHVIKSGDLKAAGNPFEKMTDEQEKYLASQVNYLAGMFYEAVAGDRSMSVADMTEAGILTGRTFIGQQALRCGLVDKIGGFNEVFLELANRRKSDINAPNSQTIYSTGVDMKKRKVVAPATAAALAVGVSGLEASVAPEGDVVDPGVQENGEQQAEAVDAGGEGQVADGTVDDQGTGQTAAGEQEQGAQVDARVAELKADLKAAEKAQYKAEARVEELEGALTQAKDAATAEAAVGKKLATIVGEVMNNMNVALGRGKQDISDLSCEQVIARYEATKKEFSEAYLAGGITGAVDKDEDTKTLVRDSSQQAVVDSVGL